jgi:hypothetical protein
MAFMRHVEVVVGPKGREGFKIDGLKIAFKIEKTDQPEPNESTIEIYNLSKDTHSKVAVAGNHITLKAGYKDETIAAIFFGDVVSGTRKKSDNEYITELKVKDGRTAVMAGQVSISFEKNTDALTIAQALLDAIGLPYKGTENIPSDAKYTSCFSFIGQATDILRDLLNKYDLMYTIQNEMIYIMKSGEAAETTGLKLSAETGLLSIPQPVSDKTTDGDVETDASNKWGFRTLLFPQLLPGAACTVESSTLNGDIKITKAVITGDNWLGDFAIDLEGLAV